MSTAPFSLTDNLDRAWQQRDRHGEALRLFHGPGEACLANAAQQKVLKNLSIDRFGNHLWLTLWEDDKGDTILQGFNRLLREPLAKYLQSRFDSAVLLYRPSRGVPENPSVLFGEPPDERFAVEENGARFWIQLQGAKHPGLFLDHAPLRQWLQANSHGLRVLNTFAYTGSLSVAAALGGADHVTTLDLSKATMRWAEANGEINGMAANRSRWIAGDVFEWLPRLKREISQGKTPAYDMVIMDPPSFSRSDRGTFSTSKDLPALHVQALDLLTDGGWLVTSINSAQVSWSHFERDILQAARQCKRQLQVVQRLEQPASFPNWLHEQQQERYLKGFILRAFEG